jgi:hypothetical protein
MVRHVESCAGLQDQLDKYIRFCPRRIWIDATRNSRGHVSGLRYCVRSCAACYASPDAFCRTLVNSNLKSKSSKLKSKDVPPTGSSSTAAASASPANPAAPNAPSPTSAPPTPSSPANQTRPRTKKDGPKPAALCHRVKACWTPSFFLFLLQFIRTQTFVFVQSLITTVCLANFLKFATLLPCTNEYCRIVCLH